MADGMYAKGREKFLTGAINVASDTIKVVLVDAADYTVNLGSHTALSDIPGAARVATATLASKTTTDGIFDAADTVLSGVSGDVSEALVIYKHSGVEATSYLICYIDSYTGLPATPNAGDITIVWPSGANKIFKL